VRIVAWNVGHQEFGVRGKPKWSNKELVDTLETLKADVLFLHEYYRPNEEDQQEEDALLCRAGFECVQRTPVIQRDNKRMRDNRTLVASRDRSMQIVKSAADGAPEWALQNYLHVALPGVEIIGLRVPDYRKVPKGLQAHRVWLDRTLQPLVNGRIIILGDVNADPDSTAKVQKAFFTQMDGSGWRTKTPSGGFPWSYKSRVNRRSLKQQHKESRIDHAFFGGAFDLDEVQVRYDDGDDTLTGSLDAAISDHAALVVELPAT